MPSENINDSADKNPERIEHQQPSLFNLLNINDALIRSSKSFEDDVAKQGIVGKTVDAIKNNFGGSSSSDNFLSQGWSYLIDADKGSDAVRKSFDKDFAVVKSGDANKILELAEWQTGGKEVLKSQVLATQYELSQRRGVELVGDAAALAAAVTSRGKSVQFAESMLRGAVAKTGLKLIDGTYSSPIDDITTGALTGASMPVAKMLGYGAGVSGVAIKEVLAPAATSLPNIARYGVEGAVLGYGQQTVSNYMDNRLSGLGYTQSLVRANKQTFDRPSGVLFGAVTGALAGRLFAKPMPNWDNLDFNAKFANSSALNGLNKADWRTAESIKNAVAQPWTKSGPITGARDYIGGKW